MADATKNGGAGKPPMALWVKALLLALLIPVEFVIWGIGFLFMFEGCEDLGDPSRTYGIMYPQWYLMLLTGVLTAFYLMCAGLTFRSKKLAVFSFAAMMLCFVAVPGIELYHYLNVERHKQLDEFIRDNYRPFEPESRAVKVAADPKFRISGRVPRIAAAYALYPIAAGVAHSLYPPREYRDEELDCVGSDHLYDSLLDGRFDIGIGLPPSKEQSK